MRCYPTLFVLGFLVACDADSSRSDIDTNTDAIDRDGDNVVESEDCDDDDPSLGAIDDDGDCDGAPTALDCDDENVDVGSSEFDADCDGIDTADDCDDRDDGVGSRADDADCDGIARADDCDDTDAARPRADDRDCDDVVVEQDCDDSDASVGACPVGLEIVSVTQSVNGDDLLVTCPAGKLVVGGGFTGGTLPFWEGMIPSGDGTRWAVKTTGSGTLSAYAMCANASSLPGYEVVSAQDTIEPAPSAETSLVFCPNGKRLLGGGAMIPPAAVASRLEASTSGNPFNPSSYVVWTQNPTFQNKTVEVRAICADVDFEVIHIDDTSASATCRSDDGRDHLISGGIANWSGNLWSTELSGNTVTVTSSNGSAFASALCWQ